MSKQKLLHFRQIMSELDKFGQYLLLGFFQKEGVFRKGGEHYQRIKLREQMKIIPRYFRLYDALLGIMNRAGFIHLERQKIITQPILDEAELKKELQRAEAKKADLAAAFPEIEAHLRYLWTCLEHYPLILQGNIPATDVIFPHSSMELVEKIYQGNAIADHFNRLVAQSIHSYIQARLPQLPKEGEKNRIPGKKEKKIRILEIGAGTGGTSAFVLEAIKEYAQYLHYVYTDISLSFTQYGQKQYGKRYPFMEFRILNIEEDIEYQGFMPGNFDLVLAANILHATRRMQDTIRNVKALLKKNGCLILNEVTETQDFLTLTFGLLDGWWLFEDEENRLKGSPLLSTDRWQKLLTEEGFERVVVLGSEERGSEEKETSKKESAEKKERMLTQSIIVAESNGQLMLKRQKKEPALDSSATARIPAKFSPAQINPGNIQLQDALSASKAPSPADYSAGMQNLQDFQEMTREYVKEVLCWVLKIQKGEINNRASFEKYGVDSLVVMEINKELEKDFGKLPATLLFEHMSVEALAAYFITHHRPTLESMLAEKMK
ncbi:MAG: methyltransferase, partial [bacterium]